ncbi:jg12458 [Pararge aegeria aegeria]|uniref:Jg12458 protein n=1 Tax=Pararge aegeria aegeria TaxID=348720 RepID=A0A8S4RQ10_9NEOP|nr:jg12458 [Pararge aegeria aegeria]
MRGNFLYLYKTYSYVGVPRCWNGSPVLVSAALVDPQRGGQTTLSASQVAAGSKRLRTVELGTPYKRPMSSSGRLSVDVMMMMMMTRMLKLGTVDVKIVPIFLLQ